MRTPVTVGVVCGSGAGENLSWTFDALAQAQLRWICNGHPRLGRIARGLGARWTRDLADLLCDEELDAVVFASSEPGTTVEALAALEADKHVLIEGPLARTSAEADALVAAATRCNRRLMAYHPDLVHAGVLRLHRLIERGALGELYYVHVERWVESDDADLDLLWEPGSEAVSLVLDVLADEPFEVIGRGHSYLGRGRADVVFGELHFATGITAHLHLSCLEGDAAGRLTVVGSDATAVLELIESRCALSVYVKASTSGRRGFGVEAGSRIELPVAQDDARLTGCTQFLTSIRSPTENAPGREASTPLGVVEALARSSTAGGAAEPVAAVSPPVQNVIALKGR